MSLPALAGLAGCRSAAPAGSGHSAVVYLSDFGTRDGAVAAMKGVARQVEQDLILEDLSHGVEPFNVWEGAWRLRQAVPYWPRGTVFVSVIDPGVGTPRRSVVARSTGGYLFVTPDNGTLTLVAEVFGISALREIDARHRLPGSEESTTFHGRDVYSYTGALLAAGHIRFEDVGRELDPQSLVKLEHPEPAVTGEGSNWTLHGMVSILDPNFGNVWTNLPASLYGDLITSGTLLDVEISLGSDRVYQGTLPFARTFGDVPRGTALAYTNSLGYLAFALNQGSFAGRNGITAGVDRMVQVRIAEQSQLQSGQR